MRKLFSIFAAVLLTASVFAQSPEKMSYQAVIRNASNNIVTNHAVGMQISILQGSVSGTAVYVETQSPTTNSNGLVSIEIGTGTVVSGDFSSIDWANGPYFIKTETDPTGGTSYSITGSSQLLSVPYALHAKTAETVTGGITETDPSVPTGTQAGEMQYWNGTAWVTVAPGYNESTLTLVNGVPTWEYELKAGEVKNPITGKVWMDRNLGASQVATSSTDTASYGGLFQWGRAADGHEIRTSGTTATLSTTDTPGHGDFITTESSPYDWRNQQNHNLWQGGSGTNNPCPSGYRLPTEAEWAAERTSWISSNTAGAFASPLKLPLAGSRGQSNGSLNTVGGSGNYWSSTVNGSYSRYFYLAINSAVMTSSYRAVGRSVRCLKD